MGYKKLAFCKKCDKRTKVSFRKTDQTNREGFPLVRAECLNHGCGNVWHYADRNVMGVGDAIKDTLLIRGLNSKTKQTLKFAERNGLLNDRDISMFGIDRNTIKSFGEMITTPIAPHFDDRTYYTIKCNACGVERKTDYAIGTFQCPDCSSRHYSYVMLNGKHI